MSTSSGLAGVDPPLEGGVSLEAVFAPVRSTTAFEETVDRLGTAIRLGLLPPGTRLPAERELCTMLGIARSTLRQALTALTQSGHVHAVRGRGGGTFVVDVLPPSPPPAAEAVRSWRDTCDQRMGVELAAAVLAARRASREVVASLHALTDTLDDLIEDFPAYRQLDVRLHVELAEAAGSHRLVASMTEIQGAMTDLITLMIHPPEVLSAANGGHRRLLGAISRRDEATAAAVMVEHLRGTEHVLGWMLPGG